MPSTYPVHKGSRIAYHPGISNAEAHAYRYTNPMCIYETINVDHCPIVRIVVNLRDSYAPQIKRQFNVFPDMSAIQFFMDDNTKIKIICKCNRFLIVFSLEIYFFY